MYEFTGNHLPLKQWHDENYVEVKPGWFEPMVPFNM